MFKDKEEELKRLEQLLLEEDPEEETAEEPEEVWDEEPEEAEEPEDAPTGSNRGLVIAACLLVCHLGGEFQETAQLFSKEVENAPDNLEAILDGAYTSPALADIGLLDLLLEDT